MLYSSGHKGELQKLKCIRPPKAGPEPTFFFFKSGCADGSKHVHETNRRIFVKLNQDFFFLITF